MRKRSAYTLIEMSAVVTITCLLLGVCVMMFITLLKGEGRSRRHTEYANEITRLGVQFREDVHAALEAQVGEQGKALDLILPGSPKTTVRYRCLSAEITREELRENSSASQKNPEGTSRPDGEIVSKESKTSTRTIRTDSFSLPSDVRATMETERSGSVETLTIRIEIQPEFSGRIRYPPLRIASVLGRDHRFLVTSNGEKE